LLKSNAFSFIYVNLLKVNAFHFILYCPNAKKFHHIQ
jgi:hypothetical protein